MFLSESSKQNPESVIHRGRKPTAWWLAFWPSDKPYGPQAALREAYRLLALLLPPVTESQLTLGAFSQPSALGGGCSNWTGEKKGSQPGPSHHIYWKTSAGFAWGPQRAWDSVAVYSFMSLVTAGCLQ